MTKTLREVKGFILFFLYPASIYFLAKLLYEKRNVITFVIIWQTNIVIYPTISVQTKLRYYLPGIYI